jgi:hypothetical protein
VKRLGEPFCLVPKPRTKFGRSGGVRRTESMLETSSRSYQPNTVAESHTGSEKSDRKSADSKSKKSANSEKSSSVFSDGSSTGESKNSDRIPPKPKVRNKSLTPNSKIIPQRVEITLDSEKPRSESSDKNVRSESNGSGKNVQSESNGSGKSVRSKSPPTTPLTSKVPKSSPAKMVTDGLRWFTDSRKSPEPVQNSPPRKMTPVQISEKSSSSDSFDDFERDTISKWNEEEPHSMGMSALPKYTSLEIHRTPKPTNTKILEKNIKDINLTPSRPVQRRVSNIRILNFVSSFFLKIQILELESNKKRNFIQ